MRSRLLTAALGISLLFSGIVAPPRDVASASEATAYAAAATDIASSAAATKPSRRWIGFYQPGTPSSITPLADTEWSARARAKVSSYYTDVSSGFNATWAGRVRARGTVPLITLEIWEPGKGVNQSKYSMDAITAGTMDSYLRQYARDARAYGGPIWLRPFHEMNGNWYPWCGTVNGNTPQKSIAAWRHIRSLFIQEGATNVLFVWSPNIHSIPWGTSPPIKAYWPGEAYVDIMALDGFNFGAIGGRNWNTFESLYTGAYREVAALSPAKPIIVAETGCTATGGDKATWISDMFEVIPRKFPRIVGVVWFNSNKDRDWRIDSSSASRQAFVAASSGYHWINKTANSVTIKSSKKTTKRKKAFTLSGSMRAGRSGDRVRVEVKKPGSKTWALSSSRTLSGTAWRYKFKPGRKGTYRFRVRYFGDYRRKPATSRTIKVVVR